MSTRTRGIVLPLVGIFVLGILVGSCSRHDNASVEEEILIYLGYRSGSSHISKICGVDYKGAWQGLPPGVGWATGLLQTYGPNEEVRILWEPKRAAVVCVEGTIVQFTGGRTIIMKDDTWVDHNTGERYMAVFSDYIKIK